MQARVITGRFKPGTFEEAIRIYREFAVPAAEQQQGNTGAILLLDMESGRGVSITFWDTEEHMIAGEASGYLQDQIANFAGMCYR